MRIENITIHNFRSLKDATFNFYNYTTIVGTNNAGKSNVLAALRMLYDANVKYNYETDFPKFKTEDNDSWIDIIYRLNNEESANLKEEYKNNNNTLRVRKYFISEDKNKCKSNQSNIFGYENDVLSDNLFYGAKNVSEAKLGSVIYIPGIAKTDETLKLTGPSPLREVINFVMRKVISSSKSFESLRLAFDEFNNKFKDEVSDGFSLNRLKDEINNNLKEWEIEFGLNINSIRPEDIVKNLIEHYIKDKSINDNVNINCIGQGLQRDLIFTLIMLSAKYTDRKIYGKKEFAPDFTLILFEEPEVFLHPCRQELLNTSLKSLASEENQQVIVTTHSPIFVSKKIEHMCSLIKLKRDQGISNVYQVSEDAKISILEHNNRLAQILKEVHTNDKITDDTMLLSDEESIRYILWFDAERCSAFFAEFVLICEGATEKIFIDYLEENQWNELRKRGVYVLDAMGKFNIHRYMNLFKELGINHSVLADKDENKGVHASINNFIITERNRYTKSIDFFDKDIESFLGIPYPPNNRRDKKPLNIILHYIIYK